MNYHSRYIKYGLFSYVDFSYFSKSKITYHLIELNLNYMSYNIIYTTTRYCSQ